MRRTTTVRAKALRRRADLVCAGLVLLALLALVRVAGASTLPVSAHSYLPSFAHRACSALVETATVAESTTVLETVTLSCVPTNRVRRP